METNTYTRYKIGTNYGQPFWVCASSEDRALNEAAMWLRPNLSATYPVKLWIIESETYQELVEA